MLVFYGTMPEIAGNVSASLELISMFQEGAPGTCIGALRFVDFGTIRLIQQLDALDDDAHIMCDSEVSCLPISVPMDLHSSLQPCWCPSNHILSPVPMPKSYSL